MFIPPQVNKFYFYDLSPEKSFFQYCLNEGLQVFTVSWRNPRAEHADWGIDHYISALKEAIEVVQGISGSKTINVTAPCSGGITATILAGHYKALGQDVINAMTLPVCVLQQDDGDSDLTLFVNERAIEASRSSSRKNGVLKGKDLAKIFAWMRPNDLIFNYVVNNYLLGNSPPVFDILYWNNDPTNLPAQLHSDFLDIIGTDALARPGDLSVCDTEIDLTSVDRDLFLIGGLTDHSDALAGLLPHDSLDGRRQGVPACWQRAYSKPRSAARKIRRHGIFSTQKRRRQRKMAVGAPPRRRVLVAALE